MLKTLLLSTSLLLTAFGALAQGSRETAASPLGALPVEINPMGTQPGPDRSLPERTNPYGMKPNVLQEGRRLFVWYNCYGCHGGRGGGGMGPSLRDAAWRYGNSEEDIYASIAEGRRFGMPAWGVKLPAEQIWKITAYIKSMGTDMEPSPPPKNPVFPNPPPRRDVEGVRAGGGAE